MALIPAAGMSFLQGYSDPEAAINETPQFSCSFSYDYWLDSTEVTRGEYALIMGALPACDSICSAGPQCPITCITWFDAVFFCNEKSKQYRLDTVYQYSAMKRNSAGNIYDLVGLITSYGKDGIRLPTESEWEYAARLMSSGMPFANDSDSATAISEAWFSSNSGNCPHEAGLLSPNPAGLYDMAGNVCEWTNDWLGPYTVSQIKNSTGTKWPNSESEKCLKGGSFKDPLFRLRPSLRGISPYSASLSFSADFIGFRCARGAMPSSSYFSTAASGACQSNPALLLNTDVCSFTHATKAKLAFVTAQGQCRKLCFVDFSSPYPFVKEFDLPFSVNSPTISPDGNHIAFSTGSEGTGGVSHVYILNPDSQPGQPKMLSIDSGFVPRWCVDKGTGDTCLVYTSSSIDNASALWPLSRTYRQCMRGDSAAGAALMIIPNGSFHGGLSANGQFIATGFTKCIMRDLASNETKQLFQCPFNGKDQTGSVQTCNLSICPDSLHNNRCMFLDFGSAKPSTLVGSAYGVHQYIFIADFSGRVISWYGSPAGEKEWDNPEWTNHPNFAIATARDATDNAHAIYAINLGTGSYLKIIEGTNLFQPFLWVAGCTLANEDLLSLDSLGKYNDPLVHSNQNFLTNRLHWFWQNHNRLETVFVGSSHFAQAVNPQCFNLNRVATLACPGGDLTEMIELAKNYVIPHCPSLKILVMDIVVGWLCLKPGAASWDVGASQSKGYNYDKSHSFWTQGLPANLEAIFSQVPLATVQGLDTLGFFHTPSQGWGGANPPVESSTDWGIDNPECVSNFDSIVSLAGYAANRNIQLLFAITPMSPYFRNTKGYSRYGPSPQTAWQIIAQFDSLCILHPNCHFYDAHQFGNHESVSLFL
jgi:uncharacterized protein (TIGR02171 family)